MAPLGAIGKGNIMALCLLIEKTKSDPPSAVSAARNLTSSPPIYDPLPWIQGEATQGSDGAYTCATGTHLLLTPAEVQALNVFKAGPDHYAAITTVWAAILTAACVIWGSKKLLELFKRNNEA